MIKAPPFSTSRLSSSNLSMVTVKPPHQRRKRNNLGRELDGPVEVIWSGDWKPAQKYIKNVTLHNKSLTLLKVTRSSAQKMFIFFRSNSHLQQAATSRLLMAQKNSKWLPEAQKSYRSSFAHLNWCHTATSSGSRRKTAPMK